MRHDDHVTDNESVDPNVPHNARVWNYLLGGKDNYEADRRLGDQVAEMLPAVKLIARGTREFLKHTVEHLAGPLGIRQFLDIGTGLPTADNTHEVAQRVAPESRIVYVDNDPLVLAHARALLTSTPEGATQYVHADAGEPEKVLQEAARTLDFERPVALMLLSIVHFFDDDEAARIVRTLVDAVPSGSYLAMAHGTFDLEGERDQDVVDTWNASTTTPLHGRSKHELAAWLDGLELLDPGIVSVTNWRPEGLWTQAPPVPQYGLLARKA
ncbi:SAM-dependent methyltransferase [Streptomyces boninensis]|uniref:SAM-dependent methyltransferase n=1 Tax=Streptomyces boninensis TaxID=2039455 RepID=UPI003B211A79